MRAACALVVASLVAGAAIPAAAQNAGGPASGSLTKPDPAQQPPPAPPEGPVTVELNNGEKLTGTVTQSTPATITLDHPALGPTVLQRAGIKSITPVPPPPPPKEWSGSAELGLNGSDGNTEALSLHAGFTALRKRELEEFSTFFRYDYAKSESQTTTDKAKLELRNDWLLGKDSPWRIFAKAIGEYDQFQDWDWRVSGFGGLGYQVIKNDQTSLLLRVGAGATREFGGSDDDVHPNGLAGFDLAHKLTERQRITATGEYIPSLDDNAPAYRLVGRIAYEVLLDPTSNLSLKLGAEDTYDSNPGFLQKRNDVTYFATLVISF